jgi:putative DNA primase/helicase
MKAEDILNKFTSYKRSGKWYIAKCPIHDDKVESLAFCTTSFIGDRGELVETIAVKCFAGCSSSEIKNYLRAGHAIYRKNKSFSNENKSFSNEKQRFVKRKIKEIYPYVKNGKYLYEVIRWEPKGFSQRRKDEFGNYVWGISDGLYYKTKYGWYVVKEDISKYEEVKHFPKVEPMLYNIDYIKDKLKLNPEAKVFIVGGEKDVNNLTNIGFLATTNSGGEGAEWHSSYVDELKNLNIVVIPDNDITGYEHLYKIADALLPYSKSFKVIELPSLKKERDDVSDWLTKYGGNAELLKNLYITAADYKDNLEAIKQDFTFSLPSFEDKEPELSSFIAALTEEAKEIGKFKDLSLLGLCPDCRGTGYKLASNDNYFTFAAARHDEYITPTPCTCNEPLFQSDDDDDLDF